LLNERGIPYRYREYRKEPLNEREIREVLELLGLPARDVLRRNDAAFKENELTGEEDDKMLVPLLAKNPTLLQRPIGILNGRAVVGRPPERLLELL